MRIFINLSLLLQSIDSRLELGRINIALRLTG